MSEHLYELSRLADEFVSSAQEYQTLEGIMPGRKFASEIRSANDSLEKAWQYHATGDPNQQVTALRAASDCATSLTNAAKIHHSATNCESPSVLDVAHLGYAHDVVKKYENEINEGKKNGS